MKNYLILLFCLTLSPTTITSSKNVSDKTMEEVYANFNKLSQDDKFKSHFSNFDIVKVKKLISAILWQESANGTLTHNPTEPSVGILQIQTSVVDDVNDFLNEKKYTYEDRNDPYKAIELFLYYQARYNPELNIEKAARVWNGGPNGLDKTSTISYWNKVKHWMNDEDSMKKSILHSLPILQQNYQV